ncbi:hypothetical protein, partial [Paenibacillus typhae]
MINNSLLSELVTELEHRYIYDFMEDFTVLRLDDERFEISHKDFDFTLKLDYLRQDKVGISFDAAREILYSFNKKYIEHENKFIEIFEDCGFLLKKNNYAEFLITYDSLFY